MSVDLRALKEEVDIVDIIGKYVPLKKYGSEYKGICPWHNDSEPSLNVNKSKQVWFCPACGDSKKGDVFDFLKCMGHTLPEAIGIVQGDLAIVATEQHKGESRAKRVKPVEYIHIRPDGEPKDCNHFRYGLPNYVYTYRDINGVVGYVCRFEFEESGKRKKETLPFIYAEHNGRREWRWHGFTARPLYNSHLLSEYPKADVILVEGEKVADWINERMAGRAIAVTWVGGSNAYQKTDFSQLNGRKILFWRDNDDPGKKCMEGIWENVVSEQKYWAEIPKGAAKGWDAADSGWTARQLAEYVRRNMRKPIQKKHNVDEQWFSFLGFEKSDNQPYFILFGKQSKTIFRLTAASITKSTLMCLAPWQWWETHFSGLDKDGLTKATNMIISTSYKVGIYSPKNVKGRGAWFDDGRVVIHAGDKLIVDGEDVALGELDTNYIYEIGESFNFNTKNPLSANEAKSLLDITKLLNWDRGVNAVLLAGWCVIAPVCGALNWRPHVWITGAAGTGKSWVFKHIVRKMLGDTALDVQSVTTEAGIRQALKFDAMPVVFDEIDGNNKKASDRIEDNLELARAASADDTGKIIKGSASHEAKEFNIRSCFAFSSIAVAIDKASDRRRISTLSLVQPSDKTMRDERWAMLQELYIDVVTDEFIERLHARTVMVLPVILENIKVFNQAIVRVLGTQAMGDQLSPMLAGAYSLKHDGLITLEKAIQAVKAEDWMEETEAESQKDEVELLKLITDWMLRVDAYGERTVAELIEIAVTKPSTLEANSYMPACEVAAARLKRSGIRVDGELVLISNTNNEIKNKLKDSRWSRNYHKILKRLPGAEYGNKRFGAGSERCVMVPLNVLFDKNVQ